MYENWVWNAIIRRCSQAKKPDRAIFFYARMRSKGRLPDSFTYPFFLKACADLFDSRKGQEIHCLALKTGHTSDFYVQTNLAFVYASCGDIFPARQVFEMPQIGDDAIVAWNVMIAGCVRSGSFLDALDFYGEMKVKENCRPDAYTLVSIASACANMGAIAFGRHLHGYSCKLGFLRAVIPLLNALMDLYGKCGRLCDARQLFDEMTVRTLVSWSTMMNVYAMHGRACDVFDIFSRMEENGFEPDEIAFTSVLCVCCHAGLLEEGRRWFRDMNRIYGIQPRIQHYGCMVDLLGRAKRFEEAYELVQEMPMKPDAVVWRSLAWACLIGGWLDLARTAAEHLVELEPGDGGDAVLLSNVYAGLGRWEDVARVRRSMKVRKTASCSYIELSNGVHEFVSGDATSHPASHEIVLLLVQMVGQLRFVGLGPNA